MTTDGWISITVLTTIIACILGILTFYFARRDNAKKDVVKDDEAHEELSNSLTKISADLIWVKEGVSEIKATLNSQSKEQSNIKLDVSKLDGRLTSAEKELNNLKSKLM